MDGGEEYRDVLKESGEPPVPQTEWILNQVPNEGKPFTVAEIFRLNLQREAFRQTVLDHWNNTASRTGLNRPVDAIITPVAPTLAPKHRKTDWWGYTSYWNLADYPAAVFPVGRAGQFLGEDGKGGDGQHSTMRDELYDRLPVCLQLVGRRLNEEKLLGILNVVDGELAQIRRM